MHGGKMTPSIELVAVPAYPIDMDLEERFLNNWPDGTTKSFGNAFTAFWDVPEEVLSAARQEAAEKDWKEVKKLIRLNDQLAQKNARFAERLHRLREKELIKEKGRIARVEWEVKRKAEKAVILAAKESKRALYYEDLIKRKELRELRKAEAEARAERSVALSAARALLSETKQRVRNGLEAEKRHARSVKVKAAKQARKQAERDFRKNANQLIREQA